MQNRFYWRKERNMEPVEQIKNRLIAQTSEEVKAFNK